MDAIQAKGIIFVVQIWHVRRAANGGMFFTQYTNFEGDVWSIFCLVLAHPILSILLLQISSKMSQLLCLLYTRHWPHKSEVMALVLPSSRFQGS